MRPYLLSQAVERMLRHHPDRPALWAADGRRWSYGDLDRASHALAHVLLTAGLPAGARVGVWAPKSPEAVAALLGGLRAGAVYVPLDPLAPAARIEQFAQDCELWGLAADPEHVAAAGAWAHPPAWRHTLPPEPPRAGDAPLPPLPRPARTGDDLAYILYTSGSTGVPKGVMLTHAHALNFIAWAAAATCLQPTDRVASHAPFHFDLSIFDLWAGLSRGAEVCLLDPVTARFPCAVADWIRERAPTVWYSVPSALVALLPHAAEVAGVSPGLRQLIFAGEVFPAPALRAWRAALPRTTFHNWYGPTETNVCAAFRLPPGEPPDPLPIGRACPNFELALLDDGQRPVAEGETGELWARGPGLLAGYWGDAARTAQVTRRWAPPAGGPEGRWYNTGDRVRRCPDGQLYFVGRRDTLIKYRGYRISLLEIEQALEACPGVAQAAALAVADAQGLVTAVRAFALGATINPAQLRQHLRERLPAYMIPDGLTAAAQLPLTSTGKLDRRRLAADPPAEPVAAGSAA